LINQSSRRRVTAAWEEDIPGTKAALAAAKSGPTEILDPSFGKRIAYPLRRTAGMGTGRFAIDDIVTSMRCVIDQLPAAQRKLIDFDPLQVERHR
jgi:hypothetical protein